MNKFASVLSIPKFVNGEPQDDTNFGIGTLMVARSALKCIGQIADASDTNNNAGRMARVDQLIFEKYLRVSAAREVRPHRRGRHLGHHARRRDRRRTPASASSATDL